MRKDVALDIDAGESDLIDRTDELADRAGFEDFQPPAADRELGSLGVEGSAEHHLARVLGDVDEAAGTDGSAAELGGVDVASCAELAEAEEGDAEPPLLCAASAAA